jgi:hypothetical protein
VDDDTGTKMQEQLAAIRANLARMRAESRESLRRLAATREAADVVQAARRDDGHPPLDPGRPA